MAIELNQEENQKNRIKNNVYVEFIYYKLVHNGVLSQII